MGEIRAVSVRVQRLDDVGQPTGEPVPVQNVTIHVNEPDWVIRLNREADSLLADLDAELRSTVTIRWEVIDQIGDRLHAIRVHLRIGDALPHDSTRSDGFDPWSEPIRRIMSHRSEQQAVAVMAEDRRTGRAVISDEAEMRRLTCQATDPFGLNGWA